MDPADIIAHAASLTEADLAAIIRAKCPTRAAGHPIECVWFNVRNHSFDISLHTADECTTGHETIEAAVTKLSAKLGITGQDKAARLRAKAAEILATANTLDPQPFGVIPWQSMVSPVAMETRSAT